MVALCRKASRRQSVGLDDEDFKIYMYTDIMSGKLCREIKHSLEFNAERQFET